MIGQSRTRPAARNNGSTDRSSARITGPMRRRSMSQRREPASHCPPALRIMPSNSRGQRNVTQLPSAPNSTGPILGGTGQGARMTRFCAKSERGAITHEAAANRERLLCQKQRGYSTVNAAKDCKPLGCALCISGRSTTLFCGSVREAGAECGMLHPGAAGWSGGRIAYLIHCGGAASLGIVLRRVTRHDLRQTEPRVRILLIVAETIRGRTWTDSPSANGGRRRIATGHSVYDRGFKDQRPWNAGRKLGTKRALRPQ
jgi:hypothetical protein